MAEKDIYIDPFFDVPNNVDGIKTAPLEEGYYIEGGVDESSFGDYENDESIADWNDEDADTEFDDGVMPDTFEIVSQVVRHGTGGSTSVDIIGEVEDLPGVTDYEVRIVKV